MKLFPFLSIVFLYISVGMSNHTRNYFKLISFIASTHRWREVAIVDFVRPRIPSTSWRKVLGNFVHISQVTNDSNVDKLLLSSLKHLQLPVVVLLPNLYSVKYLEKISRKGLMNKYFSWWIFLNHSKLYFGKMCLNTCKREQLKRAFQQLQVQVDSDVTLVLLEDNIPKVQFWDVYKVAKNGSIHIKQISHSYNLNDAITNFSAFSLLYEKRTKIRTHNLQYTVLKVGVLLDKQDYYYDCNALRDPQTGEVKMLGGYSAEILKILTEQLKIKVQFVGKRNWGKLNEEGQWTGLMGLLAGEQVDMALCHPTLSPSRSLAVNFLHSTLHSKRVLVYKAARLPLTQDVFVLTFRKSLWLCFMITVVLLPVCLYFCMILFTRYQEDSESWNWMQALLWIVAATCQQGCAEQPHGTACSILFIVGYLSMYLLYTAFAAGVTSLLAIQGKDMHLQLIEIKRMNAEVGAYWDGLIPDYFQGKLDPILSSIYSSSLLRDHNRLRNMQDLFRHISKEKSVGISSLHPVTYYMTTKLKNEEACQITISAISGTSNYKAFATAKNFQYSSIFNYWLLRLREAGLLQVAARRNFQKCECFAGPEYSSASLSHVASTVIILGIGIILSILFLLLERAWYYRKTEHKWEMKSKEEIVLYLDRKSWGKSSPT